MLLLRLVTEGDVYEGNMFTECEGRFPLPRIGEDQFRLVKIGEGAGRGPRLLGKGNFQGVLAILGLHCDTRMHLRLLIVRHCPRVVEVEHLHIVAHQRSCLLQDLLLGRQRLVRRLEKLREELK